MKKKVVVNRLQLVRQRVYPADTQAEIWIELEGDPEGISLEANPQQAALPA